MPKRRGRRKSKPFKLKLKKNTIYTIFGIGFFLFGIFLLITFFKHADSTAFVKNQLSEKFGGLAFFAPFVFIFLGFLFLHLKFYLSRLNVTIGYILLFVAFIGLTRSGSVGAGIIFYPV